jgi:molybdopterin-guanine dinucleotide biosynthesis protein A
MGTDKAEIEISGVTLLDRVAGAIGQVTGRVVVLGRERAGYECWPDEAPTPGPLAGLATALGRMGEDRVLMVAVDNAFVRAETLGRLAAIDSELPVVPVDAEGVRQVTCAIYPMAVASIARDEAETGGSIQTLLDRVSFLPVTPEVWSVWAEDGRSWFSVDTPEDIDLGRARFA